jgi:hypothetical protein
MMGGSMTKREEHLPGGIVLVTTSTAPKAKAPRRAPEEIPNLDAMNADELRAWAGSRRGLAPTYARLKARAWDARIAGRIGAALRDEDQADRIYDRLPASRQW